MKNFIILFISCILFSGLVQQNSMACTTFQLNHSGQIFVGKNYDWMVEDGLVIVNKRGLSKTAMRSVTDPGTGNPANWTSKYGSITFNQYGREAPAGGMNEAGLVVESMALMETRYPEPDSRASISMIQWIQYQLDNFASVKEVIESDAQLRIRPKKGVSLHYLVSDRQGNCVAIEFIDGKRVCHTGKTMPYKALTNSTYAESVEFLKQGKLPEPDKAESTERFINAANKVKNYKPGDSKSPLDYSFDILKSTSWSTEEKWKDTSWTTDTKWSIVYDVHNLRISFRTLKNQQIRSINLKSFDFSCTTPVRVLDITAELSGDVTKKFIDYTQQINRKLIGDALRKTPYLPRFPDDKLDSLSKYPDKNVCKKQG
ncbi:MAG: linear amide C-N hydrolase [Desulfobacteraceae bacterium]|nr:linear amide C-N hydrolase [Desulfobacteraceae bacterium]